MSNKPIYSKQVIEIADWLYSNTTKKRNDVVVRFGSMWSIPKDTLIKWYNKARIYNKERLNRHEDIKEKIEDAEKKEAVKSNILSRNESLEILSSIAKGYERKIGDKTLIPTDTERTRAISELSDLEGWKAPIKTAQTDSQGNDIQRPTIKLPDGTEIDI